MSCVSSLFCGSRVNLWLFFMGFIATSLFSLILSIKPIKWPLIGSRNTKERRKHTTWVTSVNFQRYCEKQVGHKFLLFTETPGDQREDALSFSLVKPQVYKIVQEKSRLAASRLHEFQSERSALFRPRSGRASDEVGRGLAQY